jgi:SanA protein
LVIVFMRKFFKRLFITLLLLGAISAAIIVAFTVWLHATYANRIYASIDDLPRINQPRIAIVFGAGLTRSGEPTPALYDRVATAADLYQRGLVSKLLLSGDNRFVNYNEPEAMRRTAVKLGVPDEDLVLDYAGRRTYDSCYRAREIFGVKHAILVTQAFHLDRALYLCDAFGIDSLGVIADRRSYTRSSQTWWSIREAAATVAAWLDVNVTRPTPVLGSPRPIGN